MDIVLMIIYATILLGFLVIIHEGGHYLAARAFGVRVTEFMLGLPGPSIGFTRGGTRFGVTAGPLGGYAKGCGMEAGEMSPHLEAVLAALYRRGTANMEDIARDCGISDDEAYDALEELVEWGSIKGPTKKDQYNTSRAVETAPTKKQLKAAAAGEPAPASYALGQARPRIALLNVGTEDIKGNHQVKLASSLLQQAEGLNYIGYIEGDGLYRGEADVVVCDGFVGNILLKSSEGLASMISARIEALFTDSFGSRMVGALALPLLRRLQGDLTPARHNGASFLGLQGIVVKSHGAAGSDGFQSAIRRALIEIRENLPQRLHGRLEDLLL